MAYSALGLAALGIPLIAPLALGQKELDGRRRELEAATARDAADRRRTAAEATEQLQTVDTGLDRATALELELAAALRSTATPDEVG
jgi:hypothetical protein